MHPDLTASLADQRCHDLDLAVSAAVRRHAARPAAQPPRVLPRIHVTWTRTSPAGRSWTLVISATRAA